MFLCSVLERVLARGEEGGGTAYRVQALLLAVVFNIGNRDVSDGVVLKYYFAIWYKFFGVGFDFGKLTKN